MTFNHLLSDMVHFIRATVRLDNQIIMDNRYHILCIFMLADTYTYYNTSRVKGTRSRLNMSLFTRIILCEILIEFF